MGFNRCCSVQGSKGSIYWNIVAEKGVAVNRNVIAQPAGKTIAQSQEKFPRKYIATAFSAPFAYTVPLAKKGGTLMVWYNGFCADLDDLIFDKDDGGPSER